MTDLAVLAVGFGILPLAALLLYSLRETLLAHPEASWGLLAGVVAFLALSHAMADVLLNHALFGDAWVATAFATTGLLVGAGTGWVIVGGPSIRITPTRIVWAAAVFLFLHSFSDGLVLGAGFIPGVPLTLRIDALTITATGAHRFAEGALVIVPAIVAIWKPRSAFLVLFASLAAIPAAFVPGWVFVLFGSSPTRATVQLAIPTFLSATEAAFGLLLLARAFLPMAADRGTRWALWTVIGFIGISVIHFFVE